MSGAAQPPLGRSDPAVSGVAGPQLEGSELAAGGATNPPSEGSEPAANEPVASPLEGYDPAKEFRERAYDFFSFLPIVGYFFLYWTPKEYFRHVIRVGALSFLSFSAFLLWAEVVVEFVHGEVLSLVIPESPSLKWSGLALFSASIVALLIHHHHERKHKDSEFHLAERMWEFMIKRKATSLDDCIKEALPLFFDVFGRCKISHISIGLPDGESIKIQRHHVHPRETSDTYFRALPVKNSVAGRVYDDGLVRYVPRLFFPINSKQRRLWARNFNHAMVFKIKQTQDKHLDIFHPNLNLKSFNSDDVPQFVFRSFVTVPLQPQSCPKPIGVLNIDFDATDPLDRIHIKMAAFLGVVLADEMRRVDPTIEKLASRVPPNSP